MNIRTIILVCFAWFGISGCFARWVMTEKEIREYYKDKPVKPTYFTIQNDSVKLFCATTGADTLPPLLLVHGAPGAWYGNRSILDDTMLQKRFHIITMDRLGYNKSKFKNRNKSVTSIETQAVAIAQALGLNKSKEQGVVLGSSYGAPIAARVAMLYPEKFFHVFLLAPAIDPDTEKFWWFHRYIHGGPVYWLLPRFIRTATDEKFAHISELRKLQVLWPDLEIPVTVVQGGSDDIISPTNIDYARKHLLGKRADFIYLPEAGHMIRFQQSELVREILLKANEADLD
jgi:pimeloyl-ACP methyl ester carboxylesterase